jgi:hypothetical protein
MAESEWGWGTPFFSNLHQNSSGDWPASCIVRLGILLSFPHALFCYLSICLFNRTHMPNMLCWPHIHIVLNYVQSFFFNFRYFSNKNSLKTFDPKGKKERRR